MEFMFLFSRECLVFLMVELVAWHWPVARVSKQRRLARSLFNLREALILKMEVGQFELFVSDGGFGLSFRSSVDGHLLVALL